MKRLPLPFKKFLCKKISVAALIIFVIIVITAIIGPALCTYDPITQDIPNKHLGISSAHYLGTDYLGRDIFTRIVFGARISLLYSFSAVFAACIIGTLLGLISGYFGGIWDGLISVFIELLLSLPSIITGILIILFIGKREFSAIPAICLPIIPQFAMISRSTAIGIKNADYVKISRLMGASHLRILRKHVLANIMPFIIVTFTINLGTAVLNLSALSFLGIGVVPPLPEWGSIINLSKDFMATHPAGILAPGAAIFLVVLSTNLIGHGIKESLDPAFSLYIEKPAAKNAPENKLKKRVVPQELFHIR